MVVPCFCNPFFLSFPPVSLFTFAGTLWLRFLNHASIIFSCNSACPSSWDPLFFVCCLIPSLVCVRLIPLPLVLLPLFQLVLSIPFPVSSSLHHFYRRPFFMFETPIQTGFDT